MYSNNISYATQLNDEGYIVVPIFTKIEVDNLRLIFLKTLEGFPEYNKHVTQEYQYSKTGFGTLATASSFHNPFVRYIRIILYQRLFPIFQHFDTICLKAIACDPNKPGKIIGFQNRHRPRQLHQLLDRMLVRVKGQSPSVESWHQDLDFFTIYT